LAQSPLLGKFEANVLHANANTATLRLANGMNVNVPTLLIQAMWFVLSSDSANADERPRDKVEQQQKERFNNDDDERLPLWLTINTFAALLATLTMRRPFPTVFFSLSTKLAR
jgi:hypothetical protein